MSTPFVTRQQIYDVLDDVEQNARNNRLLDAGIRAVHSRIELEIGTPYQRTPLTRHLDASSDPDLTIPGFGAESITSVTEDGTALDAADYELDHDDPHILRRLDSDGKPQNWLKGLRIITLVYVPARVPEAIIDAERVEVVRWFRGAQGAFADRIGTDNSNVIPFNFSLTRATRDTIAAISSGGGCGVW